MYFLRYLALSIFLFSTTVFAFDSQNDPSSTATIPMRFKNIHPNVLAHILEYVKPRDILRLEESGDIELRGKLQAKEMNYVWKIQYLNRKNRKANDFSSDVKTWKDLYKFVSTLWRSVALLDWSTDQIIEEITKFIPNETPLHFHLQAFTTECGEESRILFESAVGLSAEDLIETPSKLLTHFRYFKPSVVYILEDLLRNKKRYSQETVYQALVSLGNQDIDEAQGYVSRALYDGKIGKNLSTENDRFAELMSFAQKGWQHAQFAVVRAVVEDRFMYKGISLEGKYKELLRLSSLGWCDAHEELAILVNQHGSEISMLDEAIIPMLEGLAHKGSIMAQRAIVDRISSTEESSSEEDQGLENILKYADQGNFYAKDMTILIAKKQLEKNVTREERYKIFKVLSYKTQNEIDAILKTGELGAGNFINSVALKYLRIFVTKEVAQDQFVSMLSENIQRGEKIESSIKKLKLFALQGNIRAQIRIVQMLTNDLVERCKDNRECATQFEELRTWSLVSKVAADEVIKALTRGHFDQFKRSSFEREKDVKKYAQKGNLLAQSSLIEEYDEQRSTHRWGFITSLLLFLAPNMPLPDKIL